MRLSPADSRQKKREERDLFPGCQLLVGRGALPATGPCFLDRRRPGQTVTTRPDRQRPPEVLLCPAFTGRGQGVGVHPPPVCLFQSASCRRARERTTIEFVFGKHKSTTLIAFRMTRPSSRTRRPAHHGAPSVSQPTTEHREYPNTSSHDAVCKLE